MDRRYRKSGFIVTGNALVASAFVFLVGVLGFNFFAVEDPTTELSIETHTTEFTLGEEVLLDIYVISRVPVTALDMKLEYNKEIIEMSNVHVGDSVIDVWVSKPTISNATDELNLTGGVTKRGGIVGRNKIATLALTPVAVGTAELSIQHSLVLSRDDGETTAFYTPMSTSFIQRELQNPDQTNVIRRNETKTYRVVEYTPPHTDLNNDGKSTIADLSIFLSDDDDIEKDFNDDGEVNLKDMSILLSKILVE